MNTTFKEQSQPVYALHMKQIVVAVDLSTHSQISPNCGFEFRVGSPADQVSQLARTFDADSSLRPVTTRVS
jgi:hypothetical protein